MIARSVRLALGGALVALVVVLLLVGRRRVAADAAEDVPIVAPARVVAVGREVELAIDDSLRGALHLELVALRTAAARVAQRLMGEVVLEPERVLTVRAPLAGRLAALGSGPAWPAYGAFVRRGDPLAQISDARPLTAPGSGTVSRVLATPGEFVQPGQPLLELTDFSRPLVRVAATERAEPQPTQVELDVGGGQRRTARLVGPAPEADPVTHRPAYLYRSGAAWPGARPGASVAVLVEAAGNARGQSGLRVPDAAVVQWEGLAWAYVKRAPGRYARVRVPTGRAVEGGWLVSSGVREGDSVVVRGAEQLLSEEFRGRVSVGDETGD